MVIGNGVAIVKYYARTVGISGFILGKVISFANIILLHTWVLIY